MACVTLPLRQHIGISAVPCVAPGERVTRGQLLADIPADALGAPVHASIDGGLRHHGAGHYACKRLIMTQAIGILELTSIAGDGAG